MFGIGIPELVLIAIVTLVVVGPKRLPTTLRALGRAIAEFRRASQQLRESVGYDEVVNEVTRPLREGLAGIKDDVLKLHDEAGENYNTEYPEGGPDDYGALPENANVYTEEPAIYGVAAESPPPGLEGTVARGRGNVDDVEDGAATPDNPGAAGAPPVDDPVAAKIIAAKIAAAKQQYAGAPEDDPAAAKIIAAKIAAAQQPQPPPPQPPQIAQTPTNAPAKPAASAAGASTSSSGSAPSRSGGPSNVAGAEPAPPRDPASKPPHTGGGVTPASDGVKS